MKKMDSFHGMSIYIVILIFCIGLNANSADKFIVDKSTFIARGNNETICTINQYGYYSVFTKSKQGTAFRIIDRMKGPDTLYGGASREDGRTDRLFDEGSYKIRMFSGANDEGNVALNVVPFKELNVPDAPLLKNNRYIETSLGDFEQISYWVEAGADETVFFEASGRALSKMYVWKDGSWLVNVNTYKSVDESVEGKPRNIISLSAKFEPGYYKITLYGGQPLKWANDDMTSPIYIRYGADIIPVNSRFVDTISSMGRNRYLVPGKANYFLLQTSEKDDYKLSVKSYGESDPDQAGYSSEIGKKSRTPECKINEQMDSDLILVTVAGKPGKKITLQTMEKKDNYNISVKESGKYWLSTIHSGFVGDNAEPQGFLVEHNDNSPNVIYKSIDPVNGTAGWQGKFNLLDEATLYLDVGEDGSYVFDSTGVEAQVKVEKFFLNYPKNYVPPKYKKMKFSANLEKGINIIRIKPVTQGVITLLVRKESLLDFIFKKDPEDKKMKGNVQFPSVDLSRSSSYTLFVNEQGRDADYGVILRRLPLDLDDDLPVVLKPNEEVSVPFNCDRDKNLTVNFYLNGKFTLKVDNNKTDSGSAVKKGQHMLYLKNNGDVTETYSIKTSDPETAESKKPVYLPVEVLKSFPKFDTIKSGEKIFFDLDRNQKKTFLLNVDKAGIYSLQSTGRLKTGATVRTRTVTDLFHAESNGVGRNFLLHTYLKEGVYQVTVGTLDMSAGHLGVTAEFSEPVDGGVLIAGRTFRDAPEPGISVLYKFDVTSDGNYSLNTIGLNNKIFNCRLEDREGWPILEPGIRTDFSGFMTAGSYRLISLPSDVWGRRLTTLRKTESKKIYKPKEPVELKINEPVKQQWIEIENEGKRINDQFYFTLPAAMNITISFSDNMIGELYSASGETRTVIGDIFPDVPFARELKEGKYVLELHSGKIDNYTDYSVGVYSDELVEGLVYDMDVPGSISVSLKENSLVEISSKGNVDVDGTLYSSNGEKTDYSDDAYDDWNFSLFDYLAGGKYRLDVGGRGSEGSTTSVTMRVIPDRQGEDIALPFDKRVGMDGYRNNFKLPKGPALVSIAVDANSYAGVSVSENVKGSVKELIKKEGKKTGFDFFIPSGKEYSLSVWSMDHLDENLTLKAEAVKYDRTTLSDMANYREFTVRDGQVFLSMPVDAATYSVDCIDASTGNRIDELYCGSQKSEKEPVGFEKISGLVNALKGTLFIKAVNPGNVKMKLSRIFLADDKFINLNGNSPYFLDIKPGDGKIGVLVSKGDGFQPVAGFVTDRTDSPFRIGDEFVTSKISMDGNISICADFSGKARKVAVWNPEDSDSEKTAEVTYREYVLPKSSGMDGTAEGSLTDTGITLYPMPSGQKKFSVTLDSNMAVFAVKDRNVIRIFHSAGHADKFEFTAQADAVCIIGYGESGGYYKISAVPDDTAGGSNAAGSSGVLVEKNVDNDEIINISVQPSKDEGSMRYLNLTGDVKYGIISGNGRLIKGTAGENIRIDSSWSILKLDCGPGFVKAWLSSKKDSYKDRWGSSNPESSASISTGNIRSLSFSNKPQWFGVKAAGDAMLNINSNGSCVFTVIKNGDNVITGEIHQGRGGGFILTPGDYTVGIRLPVASQAVGGSGTISVSGLDAIGEGGSKEYLLTEGEPEGFSFAVDMKQDVAIGYKADGDTVSCLLYDEKMNLLNEAPVIFTSLDKGKYFIVFRTNGGSQVCRFKPIIVTGKSIESRIYDENVRKFLEQNGFLKTK
jgi:hypothetical protein